MDKKRKEVHLNQTTINSLQQLADKKGWSLKKYMEYSLIRITQLKSNNKK